MMTPTDYTPHYTQPTVPCLVCGESLKVRLARGRKSGKPFLMLICPKDGRHFRAFVTDQHYMRGVLARLESQTGVNGDADDWKTGSASSAGSGDKLERAAGHEGSHLRQGLYLGQGPGP